MVCSKAEIPEGRSEGRSVGPCSEHLGQTVFQLLVPARGGSENRQRSEWQQENRYGRGAGTAAESQCPIISSYAKLPDLKRKELLQACHTY